MLVMLPGRLKELATVGVDGGVDGTTCPDGYPPPAAPAEVSAAVVAGADSGVALRLGYHEAQAGHQPPRPVKLSMLLLTCWITLPAALPGGGTTDGTAPTLPAPVAPVALEAARGLIPSRPFSKIALAAAAASVRGRKRLLPNAQLLPKPLSMLLLLLDLLTEALLLLLLLVLAAGWLSPAGAAVRGAAVVLTLNLDRPRADPDPAAASVTLPLPLGSVSTPPASAE